MAIAFKRAQKNASFLRMGLAGPSGSGKTYTSLLLASYLAGDRGIAVIDTERGSASKYSDIFTFDVLELDNFHPDHYIEAIKAAQDASYGALVIDSLSHAWNGTGGLLELHENVVRRQKTANSYTAWAEITPIQNRLINAITSARLHIIATMRSKTEYTIGENRKVEKVGMAPIQRDGMEYEFDVFAEMATDNTLLVQKSRCSALAGATIAKPGKGVADTLSTWLRGADGSETPAAPPIAETKASTSAPAPTAKTESVQKGTQARQPTPLRPAPKNEPRPATAPTYMGTPSGGNLSIPDFIKKVQTNLGLNPKQAMEELGVKSLTGMNLEEAYDMLNKGTPTGVIPDDAEDDTQSKYEDEEERLERKRLDYEDNMALSRMDPRDREYLENHGSYDDNYVPDEPDVDEPAAVEVEHETLAAMRLEAKEANISASVWEDIVTAANGNLGDLRTLLNKYKKIPDLRKTVAGTRKGIS